MWRNVGIVVVGALATAQGDGATLMVTLPPGAIDAVEGPVEVWDDLTGGSVLLPAQSSSMYLSAPRCELISLRRASAGPLYTKEPMGSQSQSARVGSSRCA